MKCWICKNEDELSNMVRMKNEVEQTIYVHQKCADKHNREVNKNRRAFDAANIVSAMSDCELDPTDPYAVKAFLSDPDHKRVRRTLSQGRGPSIEEIVKAGYERRLRNRRQWLFEWIEDQAKPSSHAEPDEELVAKINRDLDGFSEPDAGESPNHYAVRLMLMLAAWRKEAALSNVFDFEYYEDVEAAEAAEKEAEAAQ